MALEDYKDIVGALTGFVTFCQMFSGVFLCKDIYKNGSTNKIPAMPFVGGLVLSILFYQHALLLNESTMGFVNFIGLILNIFYLVFYYFWTNKNKKTDFYKELLMGMAIVFVLLGYVQIENPTKVEFRFGMIVTILLLALVALPLFSLGEVMRTKNTDSLPFPMIFSGFIVSSHWLLYGYIIKNNFIIYQNLIAVVLSAIELVPFVMFPKKSKVAKKTQ